MDEEYVEKVLLGETEAFRYFLERYKNMAFNLAVSIVKDDDYAEEVVQDSFLKAFNSLRSFNKKSVFKTWFYRIVINESFQMLRKLKRGLANTTVDSFDELPLVEVPEDDSDMYTDIKSIISELPANESLALNLFYLEENSLKEVSDMTGWSVSNTKVILHRARNNVRNRLLSEK